MDLKRMPLIISTVLMLGVFGLTAQVQAGDPLPPAGPVIGPELWGTIVFDCAQNRAVLRVKKIENCDVDTQAMVSPVLGCPTTERQILYFTMGRGTIFLINATPIIMKVKNFKIESDHSAVSCDVQIKFMQ